MDRDDIFDENGALSRGFLLARGYCCGNGCRNCPYEPRQLEVWPHVDQSVAVEPGCQTRHAPSLEQHELVKKLTPVFVAASHFP